MNARTAETQRLERWPSRRSSRKLYPSMSLARRIVGGATERRRPRKLGWVWAIALLLAGACGAGSQKAAGAGSAAGPAGELEVPRSFWLPGEMMRWRVSAHGFEAAEMVLVAGQPGEVEDRRAIIVRSRASTAGVLKLVKEVTEEVTTWIDLDTCAPFYRESFEKEGKREVKVESRHEDARISYHARRSDGSDEKWDKPIPAGEHVHDSLSVLGMLRAWNPAEGARAYYYAVTDMIVNRHTATFAGYETVRTSLGSNPALRIRVEVYEASADGHVGQRLDDQRYTIWISNDSSRRPLRMDVPHRLGRLSLELVDYERAEQ